MIRSASSVRSALACLSLLVCIDLAGSGVVAEAQGRRLPAPARGRMARKVRNDDAAARTARLRAAAAEIGLQALAASPHGGFAPAAVYATRPAGKIPGRTPAEMTDRFLQAFAPVYGLTPADLKNLTTTIRPGFVRGNREAIVEQTVAGKPLWGARLRIHLGPDGEFIAAVGQLHGDLRWAGEPATSPSDAQSRAVQVLDRIMGGAKPPYRGARTDRSSVSETAYPYGDAARPAYVVRNVVSANGIDVFDIVVDAISSEVLEVVARTSHSGSGYVFRGSTALPQSAQPSATPGVTPPVPNPPAYAERVSISFLPFVTGTQLSGNSAHVRTYQDWDAYADLTETSGNAVNAVGGDFLFPLTLAASTDIRNFPLASAANLFWCLNFAAEYFRALGFDEAHGNFQVDNGANGGLGNDPVLGFAQVGSGPADGSWATDSDRAWMTTPPDGESPVMAMQVGASYAYPVIYRSDAAFDPDVIFHEFAHGVTSRLASDYLPDSAQPGAIAEGLSDFLALNLVVPESAPMTGAFPVGSYFAQNFLGGLRTYPLSTALATNPLTYADFPRVAEWGPDVHADGEIWANTMWEVRGALIGSLGYAVGRERAAQLVIDALQILPFAPTFADMRDAILAADLARYGGEDHSALWTAFAKRGLGGLAGGGVSGFSFHVRPDGTVPSTTPAIGVYDAAEGIFAGEPLRIVVSDTDATEGSATVTSASGDSETVVLTGTFTFTGQLPTESAAAVPSDGKLQVSAGDLLTATTPGGAAAAQTTAHGAYSMTVAPASYFDEADATTLLFQGDEWTEGVDLDFSFPFLGAGYSSVYVGDNGVIAFGRPETWRQRELGPNGTPPLVAPFSVDLGCYGEGYGVYTYSGPDRFTVRWRCFEWSAPANVTNVAASLFPDGTIRFDYGPGNTLTGDDFWLSLPDYAGVGLVRGNDMWTQAVPGYHEATDLGESPSVIFAPVPDCSIAAPIITGPSTAGCEGTQEVLDAGGGYSSYAWKKDGTPIYGATSQTLTVTTSGTYTVSVTNGAGCVGTGSHAIAYTPAPAPPVITGNRVYCPGGSAVVLDAGAGYASYEWFKDDVATGISSRTLTATAGGSYTVRGSDGTCFSVPSEPFVVVSRPLRVPVVHGRSTFCSGVPTRLETSAGYDSYQWLIGSSPISGATGRTYDVPAAGTYSVRVTSAGCTATSAPRVVQASCAPRTSVAWVDVDDRSEGNGDRGVQSAETVQLTITVINRGAATLTGVTGVLGTTDPDVVISQSSSAFPNLVAGQPTSNTTKFKLTAGCGTNLGLTLTLNTAMGTVSLPVPLTAAFPDDWHAAVPASAPGSITFAMFDPKRKAMQAFGWYSKLQWDGAFWSETTMSERIVAYADTVGYDPLRDRLVAVRRIDSSPTYVYQTWEFDPGANLWAERTDVTGSPNVTEAAMAFDERRGVLVLFGGRTGSGYSSETWEFDGSTWSNVTPATTPPARSNQTMAFDPSRGVVVMAGGYGMSAYPRWYSDSWVYDGLDWSAGPDLPATRSGSGLTYSPAHGGVVLVGGDAYWTDPSLATFRFDGSTWTDLGQPLPAVVRLFAGYDDERRRLVAVTEAGNVLENSGSGWVAPSSYRPDYVYNQPLYYDPVLRSTVFVGFDETGPRATWLFDGSVWTRVAGDRRDYEAAAYAPFLGKGVALTGDGQTWTFNGTSWTQLTTVTVPLPAGASWLSGFALAVDAARSRVVLFGGYYYDGSPRYSNETWEFDGTDWAKRSPANAPPGRDWATLAFDSARGVSVLYGGWNDVRLADLWEWNGVNWVEKTFAAPAPPESDFHRAVYYPPGGGVLFWGGWLDERGWIWNGSSWSRLPATVTVPQSWGVGLTFDSDRNVLVATDGATTFQFSATPACALLPRNNVTVPRQAGTCGANVTFTLPAVAGVCGALTATPPSGSFFPTGTTTVIVNSTCGMTTTFDVIVTPDPVAGCPVVFTDDPLVVRQTRVKRIHVTELRAYVNLLRQQAGLQAATFSEASPTLIRAQHILELRSAVNPALQLLGRTPIAYSRPQLAPGMPVMAIDIMEIRNALR